MRRCCPVVLACLACTGNAKEEGDVAQSLARLLLPSNPAHAFHGGIAMKGPVRGKAAIQQRQGPVVMDGELLNAAIGLGVGLGFGLGNLQGGKKAAVVNKVKSISNPNNDQRYGNYYQTQFKDVKGNLKLEEYDTRLRISKQPGYQMFGATRSTWGLPKKPLPFIKMRKYPFEVDPKNGLPGGVWDKRNALQRGGKTYAEATGQKLKYVLKK